MSPRENPEVIDDKSTIDLVFKVWAPKLNRMTHRLFLLGSLKQMGAWNILAAVQAFPTSDFHTWRVDVRDVPINSTFEWSWVKAKPNRTDVKWERMVKRNRTVDCFGGVIHTIYGDGEEVFVQSATYAEVSTYRKVEQGQALVLTGSTYTTGFWDIDKAVKATECPRLSGYWKVQVAFDSSCSLQFKWAIVTENSRKLHLLEKESHVLYGRQTWLRVVAPWNVSRIFIEDTPICLEPLDHVTGRTDVLVNAKKTHTESIRQWLQSDPKMKTPALLPINKVPPPTGLPYPKSTPRHTNEEKAKEALKAFMAMSDLDPDKALLGIGSGQIASRVPTVQPFENVDDHVKKRSQETKGRSDRLSKNQDNERYAFKSVMAIKGKGQTLVAKSSGQGCAGDSCTTPVDNGSNVEDNSKCGKAEGLSDLAPDVMEGLNSEKEILDIQADGLTSKEELMGSIPEEDSGFNTVSIPSSQIDISAEVKTIEDENDDNTCKHEEEEDAPIGSEEEDTLKMKQFVQENFSDDFFLYLPDNDDVNTMQAKLKSLELEIKDGDEVHVPSYVQENESPFFEEDDYLDFLHSKVFEEDCVVDTFKQNKKVEIEYILSEPWKPKNYFTQLSGKKSGKSKVKKLASLDKYYNGPASTSRIRDDFGYFGEFEIMSDVDDTPAIEEKRTIARMLEQHWGALGNEKNKNTDQERKSRHVLDKATLSSLLVTKTPRPSTISFNAGVEGVADLMPMMGGEMLVAQYSNTELANVIIPPYDNIDHRSVARRVERDWGFAHRK